MCVANKNPPCELIWDDSHDFADISDVIVGFCRVCDCSSNCTAPHRCAEWGDIALWDFTDGVALSPYIREYRFANLRYWGPCDMAACGCSSRSTAFLTGQMQIDSDTAFNLQILGNSNYRPSRHMETTFPPDISHPLPRRRMVRTAREGRPGIKGRLSRLDIDSIASHQPRPPSEYREGPYLRPLRCLVCYRRF